MVKKVTGKAAAKSASKVLKSDSTGAKSKSAAGSALSQKNAPEKNTGKTAASAASKTLLDARTSKESKSAAASALSQRKKENVKDIKKTTTSTGPRKNKK
jgi:hypothetical protein